MKKSLAILRFTNINKLIKIAPGIEWRTPTLGVQPNNWSMRCKFLGNLYHNHVAIVEIDCLVPEAEYLLTIGTKFKLFGAKQFDCDCEIVEETD